MTSLSPAPATSTGLPRRLSAVVVAVGLLYAGAVPDPSSLWHTAAVLAALAAAAVAIASEERWRLLVRRAGLGRARGRHRAAAVPRQRRSTTSAADTTPSGGTR